MPLILEEKEERMKFGLTCVNVALYSFRNGSLQSEEGTTETFW